MLKNDENFTAIIKAIDNNDVNSLKNILECRFDPLKGDRQFNNALKDDIRVKHIDRFKSLMNPYHYALVLNRLDIVKYLVNKYNCSAKWTESKEFSPLQLSLYNSRVSQNQVQVIEFLIQMGAEVDTSFLLRDRAGEVGLESPLAVALCKDRKNLTTNFELTRTLLHNKVIFSNKSIMKYLDDYFSDREEEFADVHTCIFYFIALGLIAPDAKTAENLLECYFNNANSKQVKIFNRLCVINPGTLRNYGRLEDDLTIRKHIRYYLETINQFHPNDTNNGQSDKEYIELLHFYAMQAPKLNRRLLPIIDRILLEYKTYEKITGDYKALFYNEKENIRTFAKFNISDFYFKADTEILASRCTALLKFNS